MLLHPPIDHLSPLHPNQQTLAAILRKAPSCQSGCEQSQQNRSPHGGTYGVRGVLATSLMSAALNV